MLKRSFILFIVICFSCTPEQENSGRGSKDINGKWIGSYTFELQIKSGDSFHDISSYLPPKRFDCETFPHEKQDEIWFSNFHDLGVCVFAKVSDDQVTIPIQELNTDPESLGFGSFPYAPVRTVSVRGSGEIIEVPRTDTTPAGWAVTLNYQLLYDNQILWNVSGHAFQNPLPGSSSKACE